jgi:hypothetical protein
MRVCFFTAVFQVTQKDGKRKSSLTAGAPMPDVFDFDAMQERKRAYYSFARHSAPRFFNEDGSYQEKVEQDRRITFWLFPALIDTEDPDEREFALRSYAADPGWGGWDIFITTSIAANLSRERRHLSPALIRRSEEHLDRFASFIDECLECRWEFGHCFYRNSRYVGRNGELHIVASIVPDNMRFWAVDG